MSVYVRLRLGRTTIHELRFVQLASAILAAVGESHSELSVELVGDSRMRGLNFKFRRKDRTTDVLAFAMRESESPCYSTLLGDVVISVPTARKQAQEAGRTLSDELAVLLVHGILHLCGYDHERSEREAQRMQRRERAILQKVRPVPILIAAPGPARRRSH